MTRADVATRIERRQALAPVVPEAGSVLVSQVGPFSRASEARGRTEALGHRFRPWPGFRPRKDPVFGEWRRS